MPVSNHPISVTVYDTDNATAKAGVSVYVSNTTKRTESDVVTTNASGQAIIDLANLSGTTPYEEGDNILIIAGHKADGTHDAIMYTVTGTEYEPSLYLNPIPLSGDNGGGASRVMTLIVSNTSSTVYYARLYSITDGRYYHVECPANSTQTVNFSHNGVGYLKGFVIVRENYALIVTAELR